MWRSYDKNMELKGSRKVIEIIALILFEAISSTFCFCLKSIIELKKNFARDRLDSSAKNVHQYGNE